jgi:Glyceraldehyde 3-phosphate dehydrogenase, NAD binding domain
VWAVTTQRGRKARADHLGLVPYGLRKAAGAAERLPSATFAATCASHACPSETHRGQRTNGFGRVGRQVLKALLDRTRTAWRSWVSTTCSTRRPNAHLFKYDSNHGVYGRDVEAREHTFVVDGHEIQVSAQQDPAAIPWKQWGVQIVIESTGHFTDATREGPPGRWREQGHHFGSSQA